VHQLGLPKSAELLEGPVREPERPVGIVDLNPERLRLYLDDRDEALVLEERRELREVDDADPEIGKAQTPTRAPMATSPALSATRMTSSSRSRMSNPE
jgi:hypothetical protein